MTALQETAGDPRNAKYLDDCLQLRDISRAVRSLGWDTDTVYYRTLAQRVHALRDRGAAWSLIAHAVLCDRARAQRLYAEGGLPAGITGFTPMPYGYRRWNGAIWADCQVDQYNAELARIESRHRDGYDVQHLINGLYNLANGFDSVPLVTGSETR